MTKIINRKKQYLGQLVTVSDHPDSQVYTITAIDGNNVLLDWREGSSQPRCAHDRDSLLFPTLNQIEHTIHMYGALVSLKDFQI